MHIKIAVEAAGANSECLITLKRDIAPGADPRPIADLASQLAAQLANWAVQNTSIGPFGAPTSKQPSPKGRAPKKKAM